MDISKQEPQNIIRIRDVELGKPDAKDEAIYSTSLELSRLWSFRGDSTGLILSVTESDSR